MGLYTEAKLRWTRVLGSDSHHPDAGPEGGTKFPGSHYTWVKMAKPSLEALRLALIDGEDVSIRRSDDLRPGFRPFETPEDLIEGITIHDARFMGRGQPQMFQFSPWLNALVGGRGSGKSTVVHLLRLAMQREDELDRFEKSSLLRDFERFRRLSKLRDDEGALRTDTKLELVYRHQGVRYLISWSDNGDKFTVREWHENIENWVTASSQEVKERFPVRIFSQGQIAALAGERSEALMDLVNQAVGFNEWRSRWDEKERAFFTVRNRRRELTGKLTAKDRIVGQLEDVRRKIKRFEDAEHAKVLKEYRVRQEQVREVNQTIQTASQIVTKIREVAAECVFPENVTDVFDPVDVIGLEANAAIQKIQTAVADAAASLDKAASSLENAKKSIISSLASGAWKTNVIDTETTYDALVEDLKAQGVNEPSEYERLVRDHQRMEQELEALNLLVKEAENLNTEQKSILLELQ